MTKTTLAITALLTISGTDAFTSLQPKLGRRLPLHLQTMSPQPRHSHSSPPSTLFATSMNPDASVDDQVQKLQSMAAKLRSEAAELESEQQAAFQKAAERMFQKFDLDENGTISFSELQQGLSKLLKIQSKDDRTVRQLFDRLDANGDGALQPQEFVSVDQMRTQLEAIAREERQAARQQAKQARDEQSAAELTQAQMALLNDAEPTAADKVLSTLPYLFPLVDGLQFARFLIEGHPDNPLSVAAVIAYTLFRAIPLGGLIPFLGLSLGSDNPRFNRLIRFNMQQAVFMDIALFVPATLVTLAVTALQAVSGMTVAPEVTALANDAVFGLLVAATGYAVISSLLGVTPNQLPAISDRVESRMITPDMFDAEGRFQPFDENGNLKKKKDNVDDDDDNKNN